MNIRKLKYKIDVEGFEEIKEELKEINESIEKTILKTKILERELDKLNKLIKTEDWAKSFLNKKGLDYETNSSTH